MLGGTTCRLAAIHRLVCRNARFMVVVTVLWTAWHGCSHRKLAAAADGRGSVYCCWPPVLLAASFCILTGKGMHACLRLALVGSVGLVSMYCRLSLPTTTVVAAMVTPVDA